MKRKFMMGMSLFMSVAMLAGCGSKPAEETAPEGNDDAAVVEDQADGGVKTGLGVITKINHSKDATAEAEGMAQAYTMLAAVTVDAEGKIVEAIVDGIQPAANFDATGHITTDLASTFESKLVAKDGYGLKKASGIGKEWYEQSEAFSAYIKGKTIDEIKAIPVDGDGVATGDDLKSSVTVTATALMDVVVKAMENAQDLGASASDKLGLAVDGTIANSADAGDEDGVVEGYSNIVVATFDADGKVTSSIIDAVQTQIKFDASGKILSDMEALYPSKVEIGDDYGMKVASSIGKEWYEQAKALSDYFVGKTVADVKAMPLEQGVPSGDDLKSAVTFHVTNQIALLELASKSAN